jgi:hypothetical protein
VKQLDAYLEEELNDILSYCVQNPNASDSESKKKRMEELGRELFTDEICQTLLES